MRIFKAPIFTRDQLELMEDKDLTTPFSDEDAVYIGIDHQYELTSGYFKKRGVNLLESVPGKNPTKVNDFLRMLRLKSYTYFYANSGSTRALINKKVALGIREGFTLYTYRQAFLEAMYVNGLYLLQNGDISMVSGVDLDTMQNMSQDVVRRQNRDYHPQAILMWKQLGLNFYGRYRGIFTNDMGETW